MKHMARLFKVLSIIGAVFSLSPVWGEGHGPKLPKVKWSFEGPLGTFDRAALQRGFQVYKEVCSVCHALEHLRYEKLGALGFSKDEVKAIAAAYEVPGPLNDEGEPTTRKADPGDFFARPYKNDKQARSANNGALPVDQSLIVKARVGGPNYVYGLLTGYTELPNGFQLMKGMHYNKYFAGHQIAMPAPLRDGQVTYSDGTQATVDQMSRDVTTFLAWAAEPEMEYRKEMGVKVLIFLSIFTLMLIGLLRRIRAQGH